MIVAPPTLHIYNLTVSQTLNNSHNQLHSPSRTRTSLLSPTADPRSPSELSSPTIFQGPSLSQEPTLKFTEAPLPQLNTPDRLSLQQFPRHRASSFTFSFPKSQSFCSRSSDTSAANLHRNGKSETQLNRLIENSSSYKIYPSRAPSTMLAAEGNPQTCFTLTSPLLPPSLANTSATAPPPSSSSSRKKAKNRLTLSSLPRFPQPPSHSSQASMSTGLSSPLNSHYQYTTQHPHQYGLHASQYSQQNYLTAQQQLQLHQKDLIQQATRGSLPSHLLFPTSPRLIPIGSPGPVTPLTLEESQGGYLFAGSASSSSGLPFLQQREMDKLAAIAAAQN
ncbi:hypothetical protein BDZ91DRAFT_723699 [Kalaharituber pfeilii]|nr:hypothetical protein BDZ91DRAFT_723699 [Kalaharituber pfeilii]